MILSGAVQNLRGLGLNLARSYNAFPLGPPLAILTAASPILLADQSVPRALPAGALFLSVAIAIGYVKQHFDILTRYMAPSTLTVAFTTILLFNGRFPPLLDLITWLPVYLSASLLVAVNVAPAVSQVLKAINLSRLTFVIRNETPGDLENQLPMEDTPGDPNNGSQGGQFIPTGRDRAESGSNLSTLDLDSVASTTSEVRGFIDQVDGRPSDRTITNGLGTNAIDRWQYDQQLSPQTGSLEVHPISSPGDISLGSILSLPRNNGHGATSGLSQNSSLVGPTMVRGQGPVSSER